MRAVLIGALFALAPTAVAQQQPYTGADFARLERDVFVGWDMRSDEIADIELDVGYGVWINGPMALCNGEMRYPSNYSVVSGALPPGLHFDNPTWPSITGVPTERGHFIMRLRVGTVECNGRVYGGFEQRLLLHISGSGRVVQ